MTSRILCFTLALGALLPAQTERTQWFRDAKFGMFIHWGGYSVIGRHEWAREEMQIPQAKYDRYVRQFNPVKYDPDAWVKLAADAGAKYMVITSKHHEGFSIFRSKVSDYDMRQTPYPGDPLKMLADACRRQNMRLGFYHSIMDWHHPDYRPKRKWEAANPNEGGNLNRYIDFMKAQLQELLTGYGDVAMIWFDGEWEHKPAEIGADAIYDFIRKLQPNTLINDRLYNREPGNRADFGTPEQFVPATGMRDPSGKPILWESCVTINDSSWGYNKYEITFKTERDLIRMLVEVVSKGGNLLLNVGPKPDGAIQDEFVTRLNAMGRWMKVNGEAIYGTTASPFAALPFFGRATAKGSTLYLHVFQWPADGKLPLPSMENKVLSARLLGRPGAKVGIGASALSLPGEAPDETASVLALELDGPPRATALAARPDSAGVIRLGVESAEIQTTFGQRAKLENALGHVFLTSWTRKEDVPAWNVEAPAGRYKVEVSYAARRAGTPFTVSAGEASVAAKAERTGNIWVFRSHPVGELQLAGGRQTIQVKSEGGNAAINLERVVLTSVQ